MARENQKGECMNIKIETLEKLLEIGKQLSANRSLEPLLRYAMGVAIDLVGAETGYLVWLRDDGTLKFKVRLDQNGKDIECPEEQISHTIFQKVIDKREPLVIQDAIVDPDYQDSDSIAALKLRSVMCVPLISNHGVLGAIYVENRSEKSVFVEEDLPPLEFLASQATVAIENALLNDDLELRVAARTAELEHANQQLEHSWKEAVEMDRVRSAFFAMVAHDIRSPLATIMFALDLLKDDLWFDLEVMQRDWLETSIDMTNHVDQLTRDFLDLLSAQIGELTVSPELINIEDFLLHQYQVNRAMPWPEAVTFQLDLGSPLPNVLCDRVRIQQVITNLVSNAAKCTEEGSVTLYARFLEKDNAVLIGVRDTGVGIAGEEQNMVFDRFRQVGQSNKKEGLGLGLAICRELIQRHNGEIWVESALGEGADFKFSLPISS
jgi:signal transduction histidine kinase